MSELLRVVDLVKSYRDSGGRPIQAVAGVSFSINKGEVLGLVGESGCGKSTLGRSVLRLTEPDSGRVDIDGRDISQLSRSEMKSVRRDCQIIFQDPFSSLNPRHRVGTIVGEPLVVHAIAGQTSIRARVTDMLLQVGLPAAAAERFPHEFSGGQRQRIAIARALINHPRFLVADEAVSALDVSIQSQIINLIVELQKKMSLAMLFISHDLSVVRHVSDRVAVMYLGRIVEVGDAESITHSPLHPYTQALVSAIPDPLVVDPQTARESRIVLQGDVPDPAHPPLGCAFHTRCIHVMAKCRTQRPDLHGGPVDKTPSGCDTVRCVACHLYPEI